MTMSLTTRPDALVASSSSAASAAWSAPTAS